MQRRNDTIRRSLEETLEKGMLGSKCIYKQCTQNNIRYPPLVGNGWNLSNSNLKITIDWDSEENMTNIRKLLH